MGFAHGLTERDIWAKLTIDRSKGSEDIEGGTRLKGKSHNIEV